MKGEERERTVEDCAGNISNDSSNNNINRWHKCCTEHNKKSVCEIDE